MTQTMQPFAIEGIAPAVLVQAPQGSTLCILAVCIQVTQKSPQLIVQFTPGIGVSFENVPCGFISLPLPVGGLSLEGLTSFTLQLPQGGGATGYVVTSTVG